MSIILDITDKHFKSLRGDATAIAKIQEYREHLADLDDPLELNNKYGANTQNPVVEQLVDVYLIRIRSSSGKRIFCVYFESDEPKRLVSLKITDHSSDYDRARRVYT